MAVIWVAGVFFVKPAARSAISRLCNNAAVYVESGRFTGIRGIRLKGVLIAEDADGLVNSPVFRFDEINIYFNPWKLLRGKFEVDSVRLSDFVFNATHGQKDQWNFLRLINPDLNTAARPGKIPLIEIQNGAMRIARLEENGPRAITTVSLNGQVAVQTGKREYSFSLTTDGRFGFGGSRLDGVLNIGRPGEKNRLAAKGHILMPKTKVFENAWDVRDLQLECEFDKDQLILKRCEFALGPGSLDVKGIVWKNTEKGRQFNVDVNIEQFTLSDHYQQNAIVYSEQILQLLDPRLRGFLTRYHPLGTGDLRLLIRGQLKDLSRADINGTIISRDISILDSEFPYQLEHIQGTIAVSGRNMNLYQLKAKHGSVELQIDGSIKDLGPHPQIDVRTISSNMQFDKDLYQALNRPLQEVWSSFYPTGTTGIDYHFQRFADDSNDLTLTLDFKDTGLNYENFPYPLEHLTGRVVMKPDSVDLTNIVSHYDDDRLVRLNGQVLDLKSSQRKFHIHVQAQRIPVDDLLVNAMPVAQRDFFHKLQIEALADMDVEVFPNQTGQRFLDYIAKIRVDGKRFIYEDFPLPMEDIHVTADVTHEVIRLHQFDAATSGGHLEMSGIVTPKGIEPDEPGLCLDIDLDNFDFNDTFWQAAGEDAERILNKLRFGGRMDVSGHWAMNLSGNVCSQTDLFIQCSNNSVLWNGALLGNASGSLHLIDDVLTLENFQLAGIQVESLPAELLSGRLAEVAAGIDAEGKLQMHVDDGSVHVAEGRIDMLDLNGGIHLENIRIGQTDTIHGLEGDIDGHLEYSQPKNTWQALGLCDIDHLSYRDWTVSNVKGQFVYDPNTRHLEANNLSAALYGGTLEGDMEAGFVPDGEMNYRLNFDASGIDVAGFPGIGAESTGGRLTQGTGSGTLVLEGDLRDISQSHGRLTAKVVDMRLGQQSVLGNILTAMQFKSPQDYIFSEFSTTVLVGQSQLIIEDVRMVGQPLVFRGNGVIDLNQKKIQMDWVAFDRFMGSEDTILDRLTRGVGSAIWKVEVRGSIQDPQVKAVFLSVLTQPLEIFKKKE